jgi:predicted nucleic acid-binding protein
MPEIAISDTSCLIVLSKIGEFDLLRRRYSRVLVPIKVVQEFGGPLPMWIKVQEPSKSSLLKLANFKLDDGEREAIALALDIQEALLILDDERARDIAAKLHLNITGTLGVLIKSKQTGLIPAITPLIEKIRQTDFRMSEAIILKALNEAGEL